MLGELRDLPLDRDPSSRFLPWLVAFMVYLASLALAGAMAIHQVADRWDQGLAGRLTVQVPAPDADAAPSEPPPVERALAMLRGAEGVLAAEALEEGELTQLLEPWLGQATSVRDLPLPVLIAVRTDRTSPPDLDALAARLAAAIPGAALDDHQRWLDRLLDLARSLQVLALVVVLAVGAAAVVAVVLVTRTGLAIHRQVIELLHLIGAHDSYVAGQFQAHALKLGLRGGLIGFVPAALTLIPVGALIERAESGLLPSLSLSLVEWLALALVPLAAAAVAMATARITVLRTLSRLA